MAINRTETRAKQAMTVPPFKELVLKHLLLPLVLVGLVIADFVILKGSPIRTIWWIMIALVYFGRKYSHILDAIRVLGVSRRLDEWGVVTEGRVVDKIESTDTYFRRLRHYDILYEFEQGWRAWQRVSPKVYERLAVGDRVPVRYLVDEPRYSRIEVEILLKSQTTAP